MNVHEKDWRLDDIVNILRREKNITMQELADRTGRTRRTIQDDIRLLKSIYPQLIVRRGNGGGLFWMELEQGGKYGI